MRYADGYRPAKLRWSREGWLHKPTQEVATDDDPRVPRTIEASKTQRDWCLTGSQADIESGYYRRDLDMSTAGNAQPTYTATWHPLDGPEQVLTRGSGADAYDACVRHYQAGARRGSR
ncbi:hypothetical protein [Mycolicibacterium llatzerense]|uniref:hypothetical protein n=1 Tax=Mycolicibacterium llatzerense TaxID=280871 RepID=UPI0008DD45D5|nr:hypothetical protein [Mycolicibacterium llatzerense]